jgi:predicted amidophosphoribosyltransferase
MTSEPSEQQNQTGDFLEQRCADCGAVISAAEVSGARCVRCGEPFCRDCARAQIEREEPMVCVACWESEHLASAE